MLVTEVVEIKKYHCRNVLIAWMKTIINESTRYDTNFVHFIISNII